MRTVPNSCICTAGRWEEEVGGEKGREKGREVRGRKGVVRSVVRVVRSGQVGEVRFVYDALASLLVILIARPTHPLNHPPIHSPRSTRERMIPRNMPASKAPAVARLSFCDLFMRLAKCRLVT